MKKLILLAMVVGLLMAGTVRAEGSWILWIFTSDTEWGVESAYPDFTSCSQRLTETCTEIRDRYYPGLRFHPEFKSDLCACGSSSGFMLLKNADSKIVYSIMWKCLPESMDPRK